MRRSLLAIALGVAFLILVTWLGTIATNDIPHNPTAPVQMKQAGPYSVTLQVSPNPPPTTGAATLSLQVLLSHSQQPASNLRITLQSNMQEMDMGIDQVQARSEGNGLYLATIQFPMSGLWQVQVIITSPGTPPANTTFEITAQ
jgi:YtkA-like